MGPANASPTGPDQRSAPDNNVPTTARQAWLLVAALLFAGINLGFMLGGTSGVTNGIGALLHISPGGLNWTSSIQLLSTVICVPILGKLGDIYGHKRVLWISLAITTVGTVLTAAAPTFAIFLVGRALQGPVAALFGLGVPILRDRLTVSRVHSVIAAITGSLLLGSALGLVTASAIGGHTGGTRTVLWVCAGVSVVAVLLSLAAPESRTRARVKVDWPGALLLAAGLLAVMLGLRQAPLSGWSDAWTLGWLAAGVLVLAAWVVFERHRAQPLIDISEATNRTMFPLYSMAFAFGIATFGAQVAAITFMGSPHALLGYGLSLSIRDISLLLIPCSVTGFIAAMLTSRLTVRAGHRVPFFIGGALLAAGFGIVLLGHNVTWEFIVGNMVQYAGIGVIQASLPAVISGAAAQTGRGVATGLADAAKGLAGSMSTAAFATLEGSLVIAHTAIPTETAYLWIWAICGTVALLIVPLAALLPRQHSPREETAASAQPQPLAER